MLEDASPLKIMLAKDCKVHPCVWYQISLLCLLLILIWCGAKDWLYVMCVHHSIKLFQTVVGSYSNLAHVSINLLTTVCYSDLFMGDRDYCNQTWKIPPPMHPCLILTTGFCSLALSFTYMSVRPPFGCLFYLPPLHLFLPTACTTIMHFHIYIPCPFLH